MKRLLISLPIALLLAILIISPCQGIILNENSLTTYITDHDTVLANSGKTVIQHIYADNTTLPDGLKLTAGVPFISPAEVNKGDAVTIKIKATNESAASINYSLVLKINDKMAGSQQVSLGPAESQNITFPYVAQESGTNNVKVGTLTGSFSVKGGSFFDLLPTYIWIFIGVVLCVVVMLVIMLVTKPAKKKAGAQSDQLKKPARQKGKAGKPVGPGAEPGMAIPGQMPRPGMPGMAGMQEGGPMSMPGPGQHPPFDMQGQPGMQPQFPGQGQPGMQPQFPGQPGMQPQFPGQGQPGMQPQFPGQGQPGMQPQFPGQGQPGMQPQFPGQGQPGGQPGQMRSPQYPPTPHTSPGMQPGMGHPQSPGMPPQGPLLAGQPGMPYGIQPPAPHGMQPMAPGMQVPGQPGMPPHMQPPMGPGMQAPPHPGMQPPAPGGFQPGGMPKFSVSNLTITPNKVKVGEPINISIIVSNNGIQTGKYSVVLRISGVVENISDLTLPPGASQTASFTVVKDVAGDYYSDIDGLGGFFTVIPLAPPSFTTSNFAINPERVRQGQPVTINATVTNIGEIVGTHILILRTKGMAESQQEVTLGPGKSQNIEFQVIKDTPGFYPVSLESWTGKFVVEMDWSG